MENTETFQFIKSGAKGSFFYGFSNLLVKAVVLINVFLVLRYLSLYEYGVYKLAFSLYLIASGLLLSGLDGLVLNDLSSYLKQDKKEEARRLMLEFIIIRLVLGVSAFLAVFFGSEIISQYHNAQVGGYIKILSFLYLSDSLITILDIYFKSKLKFLSSALVPLINEISKFILLFYFLLTFSRLNIHQVLWSSVIGTFMSVLVFGFYAIFQTGYNFNFTRKQSWLLFGIIKTYGKWALAKSFFTNLPNNLRLWLIKFFISTEAVAIFSVAESLYNTARKAIPIQPFASLIPREVSEKNFNSLAETYKRSAKYALVIFLGVGVASFFLGPLAVEIFFPRYIVSLPYFKLMLVLLLSQTFFLTQMIVYSLRKMKFLFYTPFWSIFSVMLLGAVLISRYGIWGAAVEYVLTSSLIIAIVYFYLIKVQPKLRIGLRDLFVYDQQDREFFVSLLKSLKGFLKRKIGLT